MAFVATFHDPSEARQAIVDETMEPYVSLLARREAEFMTGLPIEPSAATAAGFTALWQDAVRPWTPAEKQGVTHSLEELYTVLGAFPGFAKFEWRFVKTRRGFCGGMAHTRHREVIFDEGMVERFAEGLPENRSRLVGLLAHEQLHVVQRALPDVASEFFLTLFGGGSDSGKEARLVRPAALVGCKWLDENQVTNPDGVELPYLFHIPEQGGSAERWLWPRTVIDPAAVISTDIDAPK